MSLMMYHCEACIGEDGSGPVRRDGEGLWFACECELCGTVGSPVKAAELNKADADRCRGFQYDRVRFSLYEQACQEVWASENRRRYYLNGGRTLLEGIMCRTSDQGLDGEHKPTDRDYRVAATVVQFLGTSGGRGLLHQIKQRLAELKAAAK